MSATYPKTIYTLLSLLSIKPMTGYDIKLTLKQLAGQFWAESDGQIYPGLKRCVEENLAIVKQDTNDSSSTLKKTYYITKQGEHVIQQWLTHPHFKKTHRDEGLLKLLFSKYSNESSVKQLLLLKLQSAQKSLKSLNDGQHFEADIYKDLPYSTLVHEHNRMLLEAEISWAKLTLQMFEDERIIS